MFDVCFVAENGNRLVPVMIGHEAYCCFDQLGPAWDVDKKKESFLSKSTNDIGIVVGCKTQVKATSFEGIEKRALTPNRSSSYLCDELEINQVFLV